ncbi:dehydratase [Flexivirga caeni]|uniref:Dehydratase n=1 Tax=Flexivirga caeni TaxID=2294115 RepID=A0A3M9MH88_9MICO|nr:dehydratase [Flexivirga caeni]
MRPAEDIPVGQEIDCGSYQLTEPEIIGFATAWDPQYFHIDPQRAARSEFGGLIASGVHTLAIYQRLAADGFYQDYDVIAGRTLEQVRFLRPVRAGDVLTCSITVRSVEPDRPGRSRVLIDGRLRNQAGKEVFELEVDCLMRSRDDRRSV